MIVLAVLVVLGFIFILGLVAAATGALVKSQSAMIAGAWMVSASILIGGIAILASVEANYLSAIYAIAGFAITLVGLVACATAYLCTMIVRCPPANKPGT